MATLTNSQKIAGLYIALFSRAPDAGGFDYWMQTLEDGATPLAVAQSMLRAPEAVGIQPTAQTNVQFVTSFYTNVLGRTPDTGGLSYWSNTLEALGGAASADARAALVQQIIDALTTPLTSQPPDVSNSDYQLALADQVLFTNKIALGQFFAEELRSNDVSMAKAALALVTVSQASLQVAMNFAQGLLQPTPSTTPPPPSITAADTAADVARKFASYTGDSATVDALGMSVAQLEAVANVINKIAHLSNLTLVLADVSDVTVIALLSKAVPESVVVNATSATINELRALSQYTDNISTGGVTGTFVLTHALTSAEIGTLLSDKNTASISITVDADNMTADQLNVVVTAIDKVASIVNSSLDLDTLDDTETAALLGKVSANSAKVDATGASSAVTTVLLDNLAKVMDGGLNGTLNLSLAQFEAVDKSVLQNKLASAPEPALHITGTHASENIDLSGWSGSLMVNGGGGADHITLGSGPQTLFIGARDESRSSPSASDTDTRNIETISNYQAGDLIRFSTQANAFGNGITLQEGPVGLVGAFTNAVDIQTLGDILSIVNAVKSFITNEPESTSIAPKIFVVHSYVYNAGVTPGGLANKTFFILNDDNPEINLDDTIIAFESLINTVPMGVATFDAGLWSA
ncbi:DUF4214 domain-containing protein [Pseudomonas sp. 21LCFQ02]|uniref:DUF4214 domain-containing protein n=1 Tax=Pseudomonas sp. 21LCFQ02 TaxID=2957505 RepID=UPI00209B4BA8|nr:DUF4214 domain-containing protein [Pseudomonas sp. 21LCFQ02]MCO8171001.1 DUF4214 domain-containing protein [Pseudomonas sp. 21LCFQ02]